MNLGCSIAVFLGVFSLAIDVVYGGSCSSVAVISNSWPGGYTVQNLVVPVPVTTSQWIIDITFSAPISSLSVWNAGSSTTDNTVFHLSSLSYNGQQTAGTTFNSVGFNVGYPSSNAMPTVTSILFNGVAVCGGAAAATTTTTTTTSAPTTTAASTSAGCGAVAIVSNSWPGGITMGLKLPFSTIVSSWTVDITFSAAISSISPWNVGSSTTNNIVFRLTNLNYNGQQAAGTVYTGVGFNVAYPSSNSMPTVTKVLLNGVNICTGSAVTTTTVPTTTQASTAATATTTKSPATTTIPVASTTTTTTTAPVTTTAPNPATTKYNYADVITKSLLFYQAQRSGHLPANNAIPYRGDSALGDKGANNEDLTGGYYDAGDFVKFGFPMAYTITTVAWSVIDWATGYSVAGQLANAQDMIKWGTDYFLKCHISANGATQRFYGQVGDGNIDHAYWGRPEDMTMSRPSFYIDASHPGSDLAAETAAALAAASIVFSPVNATYAAQCLTAAKQLYTFANQYRGTYDKSITNAASFYASWSGYGDELAWAATWLYRATNMSSYLTDAQNHYATFGLSKLPGSFSWDDKTAGVQVLLAKLTGTSTYVTASKAFCDSNVNQLTKTPKGLLYVSGWGPLRYAANAAMICLMAADQNMNPTSYRKFAQNQIHYALGDTGRSFVCGFGTNPPVSPHHRSSSCPNKPATCDWNNFNSPSPNPQTLWGALVGGPDASDNYVDSRGDYQKNEVACDYNAGFQGAVAGLLNLAINGIVP